MKIWNSTMVDLSYSGISPAAKRVTGAQSGSFSDLFAGKTGAVTISGGSKTMDEMFERASQATGVPVNLLKAVAKTESDFNPNCVSWAGAMGVMQLMPCNVEEYGVTDPFDPEQNIMAGAQQLADLAKMYNGDLTLTLAAYNAGSGNVAKYGGVPPFEETQNYVKKINALLGREQDITIPDAQNRVSGAAVGAAAGTANGMTVNMDEWLEEQMEQMIYMMAQNMKYSLPSLDVTGDPFDRTKAL